MFIGNYTRQGELHYVVKFQTKLQMDRQLKMYFIKKKETSLSFFSAEFVPTVVNDRGLPHGWTEHTHEGRVYYYNQYSNVSQWDRPEN